mgnify:CR=1 FL=1
MDFSPLKPVDNFPFEVFAVTTATSAPNFPSELIKSIGKYSLQIGPQIDNRPSNLVSGIKSLRINRYKEGVGMKKHDDHSHDNEHPILTSIVMLNDDYEGGIFHFPNQKISVKLKKGQLIAFPPYWTHLHGVEAVINNTYRYTINTWLFE